MSYFTPKTGVKLRGRPRKTSIPKRPEAKSTVSMRVSPELYDVLQAERRNNESFSDTMLRLLKEKSAKYITAQKKLDALEERLNEMKSQFVYVEESNK